LTGAGISVESGIAPFRGPGGLWSKYDPALFEIDRFYENPKRIWDLMRQVFFRDIAKAAPNTAHLALAAMESAGLVDGVVTQNIDGLHQRAGSRRVIEFHGGLSRLRCLQCLRAFEANAQAIARDVPLCRECGGTLKPDVIFFGEAIPPEASSEAMEMARRAASILIVGTSGEVMPAAALPMTAKRAGASVIEINLSPSRHTPAVTDIFLQAKAGAALGALLEQLGLGAPGG
jgi:NAD-dependent deacetylase